jgi:hypothetical protein
MRVKELARKPGSVEESVSSTAGTGYSSITAIQPVYSDEHGPIAVTPGDATPPSCSSGNS